MNQGLGMPAEHKNIFTWRGLAIYHRRKEEIPGPKSGIGWMDGDGSDKLRNLINEQTVFFTVSVDAYGTRVQDARKCRIQKGHQEQKGIYFCSSSRYKIRRPNITYDHLNFTRLSIIGLPPHPRSSGDTLLRRIIP
jgi:hypothetical protein